jgi:putative oxidoreductase
MNRFAGVALSLLRMVAALLLFCPGALKLFGWFGGMPSGVHLTPLLTTAGWIEVVGGAALMLGLFTRPVAFIASGEMCFAYFIGHFPRGFLPVQNHGEAATLLCFIFLYVSAAGPGPFSLDELLRRGRGAAKQPGASSARAAFSDGT